MAILRKHVSSGLKLDQVCLPHRRVGAPSRARAGTSSAWHVATLRDGTPRQHTTAPRVAGVEAGPSVADQEHTPKQVVEPAAAPAAPDAYPWTKQWWPVHDVSMLDKAKPYGLTLLGQPYVVWWDAPAAKWRVVQDRCPHRLAPLSEGRVEVGGTLACSYHGWRFNGEGQCTKIPQIGDAKAHATAIASPRACVRSYPTQVKGGMLFVWLESGPQAEAEAAAKQIAMPEVVENSAANFTMSEVPIDWPMWLEQGFDPSHGPFLHHGIAGMNMNDSVPMPAEPLPLSKVDVLKGFQWQHGGYMHKYKGMKGLRVFEPPNMFYTDYDKGPIGVAAIYATPVRPGLSRVYTKFTFKGQLPPFLKLLFKLPHWVFISSKLQDQDTVMNVRQESLMRQQGLSHRDYYSPSRADIGVTAARAWFDKAGYEHMWEERMGPAAAKEALEGLRREMALEEMLNLWERHTKHCAVCQKGMQSLENAAGIAKAAALACAMLACCLAAAARALTPGAAVAGVAAAAAWWLAGKILQAREERFVSSVGVWRRDGGLSMVKGAAGPVQL